MITGRVVLLCVAGAVVSAVLPWHAATAQIWLLVLALVCVVDWSLAGAAGKVAFRRRGATHTRLGESAVVTLVATNTGRRTVRARIRDAWVPSAGASPYVHQVVLKAGATERLDTTLTPTRRGDRPAAAVTVRSTGPLGLAYRQTRRRRIRRLTPAWTVRTLPPFASRRFLPEKLSRLRRLDGSLAVRARGQGTEFDALREYVPGDDARSIDWRATARRSEVVVRTWRPERDRRLVLVVDTGRTSAARVGDIPRLDAAMDACLLLAAVAAKAGDRVELFAADVAVRTSVRGKGHGSVVASIGEALAPVEPRLVESDFDLVVSEVLVRARKRCLVVLFTAIEPAPLAEGLLPVLSRLTDRHTVVLASVGDPAASAMEGRRGDAAAIYQAAAAARGDAERRKIVTAMRARGVEVVDAPADVFASTVTDTYLAMKAAGRL
ncbi:DUF58 domain-containing protein [Cryptosporangium phraense]|uniref:DUF58 domain-containing protein n=1 Tax=Cryptosporangium phraense TaxID=2593070 RepID=A0A545AGU9_9ACTN|nr:DUF58 domain-containing protein [Cryptosporangium phraense]TQS40541.1 DUF58 domain-containing protein [Cryptosporangium phraense]